MSLDIHHIFPKAWCQEKNLPIQKYDCILNKTPLSYKANRKIGGDAPSRYLEKIQTEPNVQLDDVAMDEIISTHAITPTLLRTNDFDGFIADRSKRLCMLIEKAMGKSIAEDGTDD